MSRIIFTTPAKLDLGQIFEHIAQDNVEAAIKHRQRLEKRWMALIEQPRIGTKRDELKAGMRSLTEGNHIIYYHLVPDGVEVLRVLHTAQDAKRAFTESPSQ